MFEPDADIKTNMWIPTMRWKGVGVTGMLE